MALIATVLAWDLSVELGVAGGVPYVAAVHGIVRPHRGGVRIHTSQGEGTRIAVLLPAGTVSAAVAPAPAPPAP
ncbi:MAG: hypothetical protein QGH45_14625 [Myxococcota bacterium]|nr:hypothetical protein [Myxococcota bacterium]